MNTKFLIACIALAIVLPTNVGAQSLKERLAPPQKVELPELPASSQPTTRKGTKIDQPTSPHWVLPQSELPKKPVSLPSEWVTITRQRPAIDAPAPATSSTPSIPASIVLVTVNGSYVASANQPIMSALATLPRAGDLPLKVSDDPTAESVFASITAKVELPVFNPPPLLRIMLPDPFVQLRATKYSEPPSDLDGLEASRLRPAPQSFPVASVEKKP